MLFNDHNKRASKAAVKRDEIDKATDGEMYIGNSYECIAKERERQGTRRRYEYGSDSITRLYQFQEGRRRTDGQVRRVFHFFGRSVGDRQGRIPSPATNVNDDDIYLL